jgi:flagellar operon protein
MVEGVRPAAAGAAAAPQQAGRARPAGGTGFADALARRDAPLAFSGHALKRLEQRGLQLDETRLRRLEAAVQRAEAKGARDSLILLDELALVVSVTNHTVVTAVAEAGTKEHVFTNIDSVVIAP